MRTWDSTVTLVMVAVLSVVVGSASAQTVTSSLSIEDVTVAVGESAEVSVHLTHIGPGQVEGFWMGVCWEWPGLDFIAMTLSDTVAGLGGGAGPELFLVDEDPIGGSGVTCGAVLSFAGAVTLAPGFDDAILGMAYSYTIGAPDTIALEFCDTLGDPFVLTEVIVDGVSITPEQTPGSLSIVPGPSVPFERGDIDANGQIDIVDPLRVLGYLFAGQFAGCLDAADVDDGGSVGLEDVISLLDYIFNAGAAPADPFGACGFDTTGSVGCESYTGC